MVAKLQRSIVYCLLMASAIAITLGVSSGHTALGVALAALLVFGYSAILAIELACLTAVVAADERPAALDLLRAWWGETLVAPRVFYWRQPFRAAAEPDNLPAAPTRRPGLLLVHGLVCNRGFWNPWTRRCRRHGIASLAVDLDPAFASIEAYADAIDAGFRRLTDATGTAPVIVAHSMGGLAVRHWLRSRTAAPAIRRVVTIGTPHRGTWLARFGHGTSGRQMRVDSDWLTALGRETTRAGHDARFTCFYGDCDNVVFPASKAWLPGADNRRIARTAHVALAFHDAVFEETLRWLDSPAGDAQTGRSVGSTASGASSPSVDTRR